MEFKKVVARLFLFRMQVELGCGLLVSGQPHEVHFPLSFGTIVCIIAHLDFGSVD